MQLTSDIIYGFTKTLLAHKFDSPVETPEFHREMWDYCCLDYPYVAIAAPRAHAKSTAITLSYVLACICFRVNDHVLIVSDTEPQSIQFVGDIKNELMENDDLREIFGVQTILKDNEREFIIEFSGKHKVRVIAKSSGAGSRGLKWRHKRPNLIVCDDLENDEIVLNKERREKFCNWFLGTLVPILSKDGKIRVVGTILHFDSLLMKLMPPISGKGSNFTKIEPLKITSTNPGNSWKSVCYRAHPSINDFSFILWKEMWPEKALRERRQLYLDQGHPEGYSQEYLNFPIDESSAFFKREDFREMEIDETKGINDFKSHKNYYAAIDMAISTRERADYSVIVVGGVDDIGFLHIVEVRRGRWDSKEILAQMFEVQSKRNPDLFILEKGQLEKAMGPLIKDEMLRRNVFINLYAMPVTADKRSRARSIQGRMKAGGVKFDKKAPWFLTFEEELLRFDRAPFDDQVDALACIGLALQHLQTAPDEVQIEQNKYEEEIAKDESVRFSGRSTVTGY